jgi:DNA-binding beta-propeller fold protein YncE
MNSRYLIASLVWLAVVTGISGNAPAEILYVGDSNDTVRRYDAQTGENLDEPPQGAVAKGVFVTPGLGGLSGPRGMTLLGGGSPLLVINQNVARPFSSAILRFNGQNGGLKKPIVPEQDPGDPNADPRVPFASRGTMVLWAKKILFVPDRHRADLECPSNLPTGRVSVFTKNGDFLSEFTADPHAVPPEQFHPESIVLGPDGLLYVSSSRNPCTGLGGQVFRFDPETLAFKDVFIADNGGAGQLNRPSGLVFDPDGQKLYVLSFRDNGQPNRPGNTDAIRIYDATTGAFLDKIDLWQVVVPPPPDPPGQPRSFAAGLLFGPAGKLFVPINGGVNAGEVRRYDVVTEQFDVFVPAGPPKMGGTMLLFENTDPATFAYHPNGHR